MDSLSITLDSLPEEQKRLAELIGMDAYIKLVEVYGGMSVYFYKPDSFARANRNSDICRKYRNGATYRQLAVNYSLSEMAIRVIVADIDKAMKTEPIEGQMSLF